MKYINKQDKNVVDLSKWVSEPNVKVLGARIIAEKDGTAEQLGYIVTHSSIEYIGQFIAQVRKRMILLSSLLGITIVVVNFIVFRMQVLGRLLSLRNAARSMAEGNFRKIEGKLLNDELGELTSSFNIMAYRIEKMIKNNHMLSEETKLISSIIEWDKLSKLVKQSFSRILNQDIEILLSMDTSKPAQAALFYDLVDEKTNRVIGRLEFLNIASFTFEEKSIIEMLMVSVSIAANNILSIRLEKEQERLKTELQAAKIVTDCLLPKIGEVIQYGSFEIQGFSKSATECGGDWWGYFPISPTRILMLIGDVTGHGVPSALVTAVVKGYCDSFYQRNEVSPKKIIEELNVLVKNSSDGSRLMTMFAAFIDMDKREINFCNAGHNFPYVIIHDSIEGKPKVNTLKSRGARLGFYDWKEAREHNAFKEESIALNHGDDLLFFYTDGLTEGENSQGEALGERRVRKLLQELGANVSPTDVVRKMEKLVFDFMEVNPQADDITFFAIRLLAENDKISNENSKNMPDMFRFSATNVS